MEQGGKATEAKGKELKVEEKGGDEGGENAKRLLARGEIGQRKTEQKTGQTEQQAGKISAW